MSPRGAWICGIGMMTPVGESAAQTATSIHAGISRYQESSIYNRRFAPMTMALVPEESLPALDEKLARATPSLTSRQGRMLRLADPALRECVAVVSSLRDVSLFLAAPEPMPGRPQPVTATFLDHLQAQTGLSFDRARSALFPSGRAGGMEALKAAIQALEGGQPYALLGGVDTYLDLYLLGTLDSQDRVLAEGVMDGFAPGEGAGFLLLASNRARAARELTPAAFVHSPGLAAEPGHRYSDQPYRGEALSTAITAVIEQVEDGPVRTVLCSLNGESFGAKEWGVAAMRNKSFLEEEHRFEHPAEYFGDAGAAIGPLLVALAAMRMQKGSLPGPCLVWCSSDGAARGATCVSLPPA